MPLVHGILNQTQKILTKGKEDRPHMIIAITSADLALHLVYSCLDFRVIF